MVIRVLHVAKLTLDLVSKLLCAGQDSFAYGGPDRTPSFISSCLHDLATSSLSTAEGLRALLPNLHLNLTS
jgi:hypothetical protein